MHSEQLPLEFPEEPGLNSKESSFSNGSKAPSLGTCGEAGGHLEGKEKLLTVERKS